MAVFELFSRRQKKMKGEVQDVYIYEEIPKSLRIQIIHIIRDTIGQDKYEGRAKYAYEFIHKSLCKEYGLFTLTQNPRSDAEAVLEYFFSTKDYEKCLDIIEITFKIINIYIKDNYYNHKNSTTSTQNPEDAINELNSRFQESGIGYYFESNELIRVDSQYIHSEAVKPTLQLLGSVKQYRGANDEFLSAYEHYRHKRYKECLNDCLKSFESLMKAIHEKRSWSYGKSDTAKKLINSCLSNKLVPEYLQNQFFSVSALLESGIPTVRNKEGGHGQGAEVSTVPEHLASYALHLTATNLLFLANCEKQYCK
ncbi:STM4504/CBY_0614 family protein [Sulfuricurvum sp.]|uniref:STM4504/CBY_0614 family protein n=1 Tax=Sulfuricurvum sp. TaxID=2025608 RepID=UPI002630CFE3|nr:hypothetical protein [Sulfuricurvum sp.]MDD2267363.1 hypothetical protein [Sulfuricurvum sp.]